MLQGCADTIIMTANLVDEIWGKERPPRPNEKVKVHPVQYSGQDISLKLQDLAKDLEKRKAAGLVVCNGTLAFFSKESDAISQLCLTRLPGCITYVGTSWCLVSSKKQC